MSSLLTKVVGGVKVLAQGAGSLLTGGNIRFDPYGMRLETLKRERKDLADRIDFITLSTDTLEGILEELGSNEDTYFSSTDSCAKSIINAIAEDVAANTDLEKSSLEDKIAYLKNPENIKRALLVYNKELPELKNRLEILEKSDDEGIAFLLREHDFFEKTYQDYFMNVKQAHIDIKRQINQLEYVLPIVKKDPSKFSEPKIKAIIDNLCNDRIISSNDKTNIRAMLSAHVRLQAKLPIIQQEIFEFQTRNDKAIEKVQEALVLAEETIRDAEEKLSLEKTDQTQTQSLYKQTRGLQERLEEQQEQLDQLERQRFKVFEQTDAAKHIKDIRLWDVLFDDKEQRPREIDPKDTQLLESEEGTSTSVYECIDAAVATSEECEQRVSTMSDSQISSAIEGMDKSFHLTDSLHLPNVSETIKSQFSKVKDSVTSSISEKTKKEGINLVIYLKEHPYILSQLVTMFVLFATFTTTSGIIAPFISITIARMVPTALKYCFGFTDEELNNIPFGNKLMTQAMFWAGSYLAFGPIGVALKAGYEIYSNYLLPKTTDILKKIGFSELLNDDFTNIIIWGLFKYVTGKMLLTTVLTVGFITTNSHTAPLIKRAGHFFSNPIPTIKLIPHRFIENCKFIGRAIKGFRVSEALGRTGATIAPIGIGAACFALAPVGVFASSIIGLLVAGFSFNTLRSKCNKKWTPEYTLDDMYEEYKLKQEEMKAEFISKEKFIEEMQQLEKIQQLENEEEKRQFAWAFINSLLGTNYSQEDMSFIVKAVDKQIEQAKVVEAQA